MIDTDYTDWIDYVSNRFSLALGSGTPMEQMVNSGILALLAYLASPIGTVFTILIGLVFTATFFVGAARWSMDSLDVDAGRIGLAAAVLAGVGVLAYFGSSAVSLVVVLAATVAVGYVLYRFGGVAFSRIKNGKAR